MAFRIFPEDERVTDLLVQMSRCVVTAVEQLSEHVGQVDKVWEQPLTDLLETEDRCTNLYFSLMTTTRSSYVVPIPARTSTSWATGCCAPCSASWRAPSCTASTRWSAPAPRPPSSWP